MSLTLILTRLSSVNLEVGRLGPTCESEQHKHIRYGFIHVYILVMVLNSFCYLQTFKTSIFTKL